MNNNINKYISSSIKELISDIINLILIFPNNKNNINNKNSIQFIFPINKNNINNKPTTKS